jgi:hypothetical protein
MTYIECLKLIMAAAEAFLPSVPPSEAGLWIGYAIDHLEDLTWGL